MYVQINVGRNQGQFDMSNETWDECIADITYALAAFANSCGSYTTDEIAARCEIHRGTGIWENAIEESAKISLINDLGFDLEGLRGYLRSFKNWYQQDNLALIVGSELI